MQPLPPRLRRTHNLGNREAAPAAAQAGTDVEPPPHPVGVAALDDLDGDGTFDSLPFTARKGNRQVSRSAPL
jgi:hypothetical protein